MKAPQPLMSLEDALARLDAAGRAAAIQEVETVSTFDGLNRVLAHDVVSAVDVPPGDNTSMDGYALHTDSLVDGAVTLPVSQRVPAGVVGQPLEPGTAARIFTGAQLPPGANAVVMQEQCTASPEGPGPWGAVALSAEVAGSVRPGQWVRRQGEDVQRGALVLAAGTRLSPAALGLAASVGAGTLSVRRRPRVALFSTGDELVMPGEVPPERLRPGAIYNSNRYTLRALLLSVGAEVTDLGIVPDRLDATREALRHAASGHDLILTSGGVSVGEEDHIKPAVSAEGRIDLWQMAIKPGKPLALGEVNRPDGRCLFVGLPGNPVSSWVTFGLAVVPLLQAMQGMVVRPRRVLTLRADFDWPRPDKRREFLRVRRNAQGGLDLFPNQSSGVLTSAVWADGWVDNPPGQAIRRGDGVAFWPVDGGVPA